ncbi:NUDIX domain-containing protein [Humidisolicoccus flavus]|uniref:NUDIX domain-containing protein n=1 Tax=Humidisolicoccus flavus TaxID=3111414 RepID=UPI003251E354
MCAHVESPEHGSPRRPAGPRDPGDAWVIGDSGERYWGRYGAAGLLAVDPDRGVLLQHRVEWSHFGGTWGIPGGALQQGENASDAALREAQEEAGVPSGVLQPRFTSVHDVQIWSYTTLVAAVIRTFEPVISDPESNELRWVPIDEVATLPLHPGFEASWERLRPMLTSRAVLILEGQAADVLDHSRFAGRFDGQPTIAIPAAEFGLPEALWFPEIIRTEDQAASNEVIDALARHEPAHSVATLTVTERALNTSGHGNDGARSAAWLTASR